MIAKMYPVNRERRSAFRRTSWPSMNGRFQAMFAGTITRSNRATPAVTIRAAWGGRPPDAGGREPKHPRRRGPPLADAVVLADLGLPGLDNTPPRHEEHRQLRE